MSLFIRGMINLHSGGTSDFKIECDALTDEYLETLAYLGSRIVGEFSSVEGVPMGGLRFAEYMKKYASTKGPLLIVDDVMTTGNSMWNHKGDRDAKGLVIFDRWGFPSGWISSILQLNPSLTRL